MTLLKHRNVVLALIAAALLVLLHWQQVQAGSLQQVSQPDLVIRSMAIVQSPAGCWTEGSRYVVRVVIGNDGAATFDSFMLHYNAIQHWFEGGLSSGQSVSIFFPSWIQGGSNSAKIDSTGLVAESNEDNNRHVQYLLVPTQTASCTATPTASPTRTRTPTPTALPPPLRLRYRWADTSGADNQIVPHLQIVNSGTSSVPLSELSVRYWFTADGYQSLRYACDWATRGCGNLSGSLVWLGSPRKGADVYLQLRFAGGAGSLAPNSSTEIYSRIHKVDWSSFSEYDDYSYDLNRSSYADHMRVTLYRNGMRVWGSEP